jgi:DMSO/TMAO reductase YedYZ molybdopterin-dependent catalytic subunit
MRSPGECLDEDGPMSSRRIGAGALAGALLTLPLTAVLFGGRVAAGLPFPPFDLFDWIARVLPGGVITAGIDAMVDSLRALGFTAADAAKSVERSVALALFLLGGALLGAGLFAVWRRPLGRREHLIAAAAVLVPATGFTAVDAAVSGTGSGPVAGFLWLSASLAAWAGFLRRSFLRLTPAPPAAEPEDAAPAVEAHRKAHVSGPERAPSADELDRRRFLIRLGGASAAITVVGAVVALRLDRDGEGVGDAVPWSESHRLPNRNADVDPVRGTRPELTPLRDHYQIDINSTPPRIDGTEWRLRIGGLVEREMALTLDDLRRDFTSRHQFVTLSCISNRIGGSLTSTTRWTGVPLRDVLGRAGLREEATHLRMDAADGFYEVMAREVFERDERVMLTYAWDGLPLTAAHGFPLRIYIPDRYGMKQPKWIESLRAMDEWEEGYWVRRGWDREAIMRTTSVIDTVGTDMMLTLADGTTRIPIGGIAHAGARGISRVEVQVDDGPWEAARLRSPLSETTWVIWRYEWPFEEGEHTFRVRCVDGEGRPQVEERSAVRPDGATGLHETDAML